MNCPIDNPNCPYGKLQTGEKCPACGKIKKDEETSYMIEKGKARGRARKIMSAAERSAAAKKGWETRRRNGFRAKGDTGTRVQAARGVSGPPSKRQPSGPNGPSRDSAKTREQVAQALARMNREGDIKRIRDRVEEAAGGDARSRRRKNMAAPASRATRDRRASRDRARRDSPASTPGDKTMRRATQQLGLGEGMGPDFVDIKVREAAKRGAGGGRNRRERIGSLTRSVKRKDERTVSSNPRVQEARATNPEGAKALKSLGLPEEAALPMFRGSTERPSWSGGSYGITIGGRTVEFDSMDEMNAAAKKLRDAGVNIGDFELWD